MTGWVHDIQAQVTGQRALFIDRESSTSQPLSHGPKVINLKGDVRIRSQRGARIRGHQVNPPALGANSQPVSRRGLLVNGQTNQLAIELSLRVDQYARH